MRSRAFEPLLLSLISYWVLNVSTMVLVESFDAA